MSWSNFDGRIREEIRGYPEAHVMTKKLLQSIISPALKFRTRCCRPHLHDFFYFPAPLAPICMQHVEE